jgi:hypothetical protein
MTRESHSAVRYLVSQLPGVEQFGSSVKDEAIRLARSFAQRHAVDLWYSEDGTCALLEAFRLGVPATVRHHT